jgi:error-prone DNA polymerase
VFGRENVFVEIQRHFIRGEERVNHELIDLARAHQLSLLATNGVKYAKPGAKCSMFSPVFESTHIWMLLENC